MNVEKIGSLLIEKDDQANLEYPKMKLTETRLVLVTLFASRA